MHWFGNAEGPGMPRCETPVGQPCERCHQLIAETDLGFAQPPVGDMPALAYHRICFLKGITDHKYWPAKGFVPDVCDGFEPTGNGSDVRCPTCGMTYSYELETWA